MGVREKRRNITHKRENMRSLKHHVAPDICSSIFIGKIYAFTHKQMIPPLLLALGVLLRGSEFRVHSFFYECFAAYYVI